MQLTGVRTGVHFLLAGVLAAVVHAQGPASAGAAPSTAQSPTERVVLKVGNVEVTQAEFEARIGSFENQGGEGDGLSEKQRRDRGDDYASVLMLSQQAVANKLDSSPEVLRQLAVARMQVLSDAEFASLMRQADPTAEEISKYYSDHLSDYDEVQIRRLFIWKRQGDSKDARVLTTEAARARADQIRKAYAAGADVQKLSDDLMKTGEGMLDPKPLLFTHGELTPSMAKVAFALKEGEWSEFEDTPAAVRLIQLVKRESRQLGQVSSLIEKDLQGQKLEAMLDDLKKKAGIWLDEQYFGTAVVPVPGAQRRTSNPPSQSQKSPQKGENNDANETQK